MILFNIFNIFLETLTKNKKVYNFISLLLFINGAFHLILSISAFFDHKGYKIIFNFLLDSSVYFFSSYAIFFNKIFLFFIFFNIILLKKLALIF